MKKIFLFALLVFLPVSALFAAAPTTSGLTNALKTYTTPPAPRIIKVADLLAAYKIYVPVRPAAPALAVAPAKTSVTTSSLSSAYKKYVSQSSTQKNIYYYTLPYSTIRANVANMSVWAALYFDKYHTYVGICDATNERAKTEGIDKFLESTLKTVSAADVYCNTSATAYVYSIRMPDGNRWCADNIATIGGAISTIPKTLSCGFNIINSTNKTSTAAANQSSKIKTPVVVPDINQPEITPNPDLQSIGNIASSVANFRLPAETVYDNNLGSYSSICSGGLINTSANSTFPVIVKKILDAQGVSNQSEAGIVCVATKDKYALEVTFKKYVVPNGAYLSGKHSYCVDSTGVAGDDTKYKIDQSSYSCKKI